MICTFERKLSTRLFGLVFLALILSGCSTLTKKDAQWSPDWPEQSFYEAQYAADLTNQADQSQGNYIKWVRRYYTGYSFQRRGWDWLTNAIREESVDSAQQLRLKNKMFSIGQRISAEWSKDNKHRLINSKNLLAWADAVELSIEQGEQESLLDKVSVDVDSLLDGSLKSSEINLKRYFASASSTSDDEDDDFGDFGADDDY